MASSGKPSTLRIAVLILPPIQLLDLSPIDLFHMLSKQYLSACKLPQPFIDLGLDSVRIAYVGEHGPNTSPSQSTSTSTPTPTTTAAPVFAEMTASAALRLTHSLDSPDVQPGKVDILLIPGPDPSSVFSARVKRFIAAHAATEGASVLSVCTGIYPLAHAGVLEGRECTGPRALLGINLRRDWPGARWVESRWAVDRAEGKAELWTAGGITNGLDMVAAFLRAGFERELVDLVCGLADVGGRGREYGSGKVVEGVWWGWLLLRSGVRGVLRGGREGRGRKEA